MARRNDLSYHRAVGPQSANFSCPTWPVTLLLSPLEVSLVKSFFGVPPLMSLPCSIHLLLSVPKDLFTPSTKARAPPSILLSLLDTFDFLLLFFAPMDRFERFSPFSLNLFSCHPAVDGFVLPAWLLARNTARLLCALPPFLCGCETCGLTPHLPCHPPLSNRFCICVLTSSWISCRPIQQIAIKLSEDSLCPFREPLRPKFFCPFLLDFFVFIPTPQEIVIHNAFSTVGVVINSLSSEKIPRPPGRSQFALPHSCYSQPDHDPGNSPFFSAKSFEIVPRDTSTFFASGDNNKILHLAFLPLSAALDGFSTNLGGCKSNRFPRPLYPGRFFRLSSLFSFKRFRRTVSRSMRVFFLKHHFFSTNFCGRTQMIPCGVHDFPSSPVNFLMDAGLNANRLFCLIFDLVLPFFPPLPPERSTTRSPQIVFCASAVSGCFGPPQSCAFFPRAVANYPPKSPFPFVADTGIRAWLTG